MNPLLVAVGSDVSRQFLLMIEECVRTDVLLLSSLSLERTFTSSGRNGVRTTMSGSDLARQSHRGVMGVKVTPVTREYEEGELELWGCFRPPSYNIHLLFVFSDAFLSSLLCSLSSSLFGRLALQESSGSFKRVAPSLENRLGD